MKRGHLVTLGFVWSALWLGADFGGRSFIGWAIAAAVTGIYLLWFGRRRGMIHNDDTRGRDIQWEQREEAWIRALQHLRHHWLNECQLIRGYTQMRRWERVDEVVCRMASTAEKQSVLTDFEHPNLSGVLLRFSCEFPQVNVLWDGPLDPDLPPETIAQIEGQLRHFSEAKNDPPPFSGGSSDQQEWWILVRSRQDGVEVRVCPDESGMDRVPGDGGIGPQGGGSQYLESANGKG